MGGLWGRWEGNFLVVEVRNYNDKGWIASNSAVRRIKGVSRTENLKVVERFTRSGKDTIEDEVTIEDPEIDKHPWKIAKTLTPKPHCEMCECACHDGNSAVELSLSGTRARERATAEVAEGER